MSSIDCQIKLIETSLPFYKPEVQTSSGRGAHGRKAGRLGGAEPAGIEGVRAGARDFPLDRTTHAVPLTSDLQVIEKIPLWKLNTFLVANHNLRGKYPGVYRHLLQKKMTAV